MKQAKTRLMAMAFVLAAVLLMVSCDGFLTDPIDGPEPEPIRSVLTDAEHETTVVVDGIIYGITEEGIFISDASDGMIFVSTDPSDLKTGDRVFVIGTFDRMDGVKPVIDRVTTFNVSGSGDPLLPETEDLEPVSIYDPTDKTDVWYDYLILTGTIAKEESSYFLEFEDTRLSFSESSSNALLDDFIGEFVELPVILADATDDRMSLLFVDDVSDIVLTVWETPVEIVQSHLDDTMVDTIQFGNLDLPLNHELITGSISWESSDESVITSEGIVKYDNDDTLATLTATLEIDGVTHTFDYDVTVVGMGDYRMLDDYENELFDMIETYPDIADLHIYGYSFWGRPLYALEISSALGVDDGRPEHVHAASIHAREWPSGEVAMDLAWHLLEHYGSDDRITDLVDDVRIWILPVTNPDGFLKTVELRETEWEPYAAGMWRKNVSPNADGSIGTDLNRNFSYNYGLDGSGNTTSITYWGESPMSEIENVAYDDFFSSRDVISVVHGHTYLEVIYVDQNHQLSLDIAKDMQAINGYEPRGGLTGGSQDQNTAGLYNALSWTIEYGKEFIPPYEGYPGPGLKVGAFDEVFEAFTMKYSVFLEEDITGNLVYGEYGHAYQIPDEADGNIVLIRRGDGLTYQTKVENAMEKGAKAVIVFNDEPSVMRLPNVDDGDVPPIPVMYMSGEVGEMLVEAYLDDQDMQAELIAHYFQQDSQKRVFERNLEPLLIAIDAARDHASVVTGQLVDRETGATLSGRITKENDYVAPFGGIFEGDYMRHEHHTAIDVQNGSFTWHMTPSDQRELKAAPYLFTAHVDGYHPLIKTLTIDDFNQTHDLTFELVPLGEPVPDDYDDYLQDLATWTEWLIAKIPEQPTQDDRIYVRLAQDAIDRFIDFGGNTTLLANFPDFESAQNAISDLEDAMITEIEDGLNALPDDITSDNQAEILEIRAWVTEAETQGIDIGLDLTPLLDAEEALRVYFTENYETESALTLTPVNHNNTWLTDFENRWDDDYTGNTVARQTFEPLRYYSVSHGSLDTNPRYMTFDITDKPYAFVEGYVGSSDRAFSTTMHPTHLRIYLDGELVYTAINEYYHPANHYRIDITGASTITFEIYAPQVNGSNYANRIAFMEPIFLIPQSSEQDQAIEAIENAIDQLPDPITLDDEDDVTSIRQMITDALSLGVIESMIANMDVLLAAESALEDLYVQERTSEIIALIDALPETITTDDRQLIWDTWKAVSEAHLFGVPFEDITNLAVLEAKENELDDAYRESYEFVSLFTLGDPGVGNRQSSWLVDYDNRWSDWETYPERTIGGLSFEPLKFYAVSHGSLDTTPRYIQYDISQKGFDFVRGYLGISDAPYNSQYPLDFVIYGDGEILYEARLDYLEAPHYYFLDVSDVTWLRFEWSAENTSPNGYANRIVFVEPTFMIALTSEVDASIDAIESAIAALPDPITLDDESDISAIRQMIVDAGPIGVTESMIGNIATLETAEKAIEDLHIAEKANEVIDIIDNLPETITLDDQDAIWNTWLAVSEAYLFGVTSDQITNLGVLEQKEQELDQIYSQTHDFVSLFTLGDPGPENRQSTWLVDYDNRWTDWETNPDRTIGGLSFEPLSFYSVAHGGLDTTPKYLQFDLSEKNFDYVRGYLGIADEPYNSLYPVDFVIYGDGEILFEARLDYLEPPYFYFLDVSDVTWLRFEWSAENTSPNGYTNRIVFVEPVFLENKESDEG